MPGFLNKLGEDNPGTIPAHRVPRIYGRYDQNGTKSSSPKNKEDSGGVPTVIGCGGDILPHPFKVNRQNECHKPSHSSSSSFLQEFANRPNTSPAEGGPELRDKSESLARQQGGVDLVGHTDDKMEWQDGNTLGINPT